MPEIEVLAIGTPGGGVRIHVEANPFGVLVEDKEALSLCTSYPGNGTVELSKRLGI